MYAMILSMVNLDLKIIFKIYNRQFNNFMFQLSYTSFGKANNIRGDAEMCDVWLSP